MNKGHTAAKTVQTPAGGSPTQRNPTPGSTSTTSRKSPISNPEAENAKKQQVGKTESSKKTITKNSIKENDEYDDYYDDYDEDYEDDYEDDYDDEYEDDYDENYEDENTN